MPYSVRPVNCRYAKSDCEHVSKVLKGGQVVSHLNIAGRPGSDAAQRLLCALLEALVLPLLLEDLQP